MLMRMAGKTYSAREIVELGQCTSEQLSYYQEIQLLAPRRRSESASDAYDDLDLLRLQQIRMGRAWGLALEETRRWLAHGADPFPAELSTASRCASQRVAPLYVELEVKAETALDRWEFQREAEALYTALSGRWRSGSAPGDARLARWTERHRCHLERWFGPCEPRRHAAFARALLNNPYLAASIQRHGKSLGSFLLSVIEVHTP